MNKEKFRESIKNNMMKLLFDYCENKEGWFDYQETVEYYKKEVRAYYRAKGYKGENKPKKSFRQILFFLRIGYLEADPQKGLRVNKDFIPVSQKGLLK